MSGADQQAVAFKAFGHWQQQGIEVIDLHGNPPSEKISSQHSIDSDEWEDISEILIFVAET
ncbi:MULTISPECIES: hypothetical protein [unclassified Paenibacillus]|uniref:hypothetical protein n=1 Tax=unclassified Paenibacillus TaxID=185978 RepID=UPI0013B48C6B|nr:MULTISPECIES: hypothetical protein [unclassified Paenibacillus]QID16017.1 hypothetical protein CIC07_25430 [Paenibacillus sp. RUD330]